MNGIVKVTDKWTLLDVAQVININGKSSALTMLPGDTFMVSIPESDEKAYGPLGVWFWHGEAPLSSEYTAGAELIREGMQGEIIKGTSTIYVKGWYGPVNMTIRKVE